MIKVYTQQCECGREIKFITFSGKYTLEQKEILVEQKQYNAIDLKLFFTEKIKNNEKIYLRRFTEVNNFKKKLNDFIKEKVVEIVIFKYDKEDNLYRNVERFHEYLTKEQLVRIAHGEHNEKGIKLVHMLGEEE